MRFTQLIATIVLLTIASSVFAQRHFRIRKDVFYLTDRKAIRVRKVDKPLPYVIKGVTPDAKVYYKGTLVQEEKSEDNDKLVYRAVFDDLEEEGTFVLDVEGIEPSPPFTVTHLTNNIRVNQMGYLTGEPKEAYLAELDRDKFTLVDTESKKTVYKGKLGEPKLWEYSGEMVRRIDFSDFNKKGTYRIHLEGKGYSYPFTIADKIYDPVYDASLKAFYMNRCSTPLLSEYAGEYERAAGHPDLEVYVHASAATEERPAGTVIKSPRGWYDAGDYNKYIVNSGISMFTLLSFYETFPDFASSDNKNLPESGNNVPDILDEAIWNLRWMLTMQDPADGGVYHKLTTAAFSGAFMPERTTARRYVVQKSTAAALDFAAVSAMAARILKPFDKQYPGLADSCLAAAKSAFTWAEKNPANFYNQQVMNDKFGSDPDMKFNDRIVTGEYGDTYVEDEFFWASAELFTTTGDDQYKKRINLNLNFNTPSWASVGTLGLITLATHKGEYMKPSRDKLTLLADKFVAYRKESPMNITMGIMKQDFVWGSNSVAANQGMLLIHAYNFSKKEEYYHAALSVMDYIFGKNGTGYSYVTGYGGRTPMEIHHRVSKADRIEEPVPGFLVGGPHDGQQDRCRYPSDKPAACYVDSWCSYATNEVTINWNAPLVFLSGSVVHLNK